MALEQHAVPSQVTAYEFRLVGDMTLKQFGWLAGGLIVGIIMYSLPLPGYIRWPLVLLLTPSGALIAFVPFEGRGLDRWIVAFAKAIYAPTEYLWRQEHPTPDFLKKTVTHQVVSAPAKVTQRDEARLEEYIHTLPVIQAASALDQQEIQQVEYFNQLITSDLGSVSPPPPSPAPPIDPDTPPTPPEESPVIEPEVEDEPNNQKPSTSTSEELISSQFSDQSAPMTATMKDILQQPTQPSSTVDLEELQKQVAETLKVSQPTSDSSSQKSDQSSAPETPESQSAAESLPFPPLEALKEPELQKTMAQPEISSAGTPSPDSSVISAEPATFSDQLPVTRPTQPNIVAGMVVDVNGKIVDNAIVEIKDQFNKPVRAFKTNKLGQFAIATALNNGVYIIEVEKADLQFNPVQFEASGQVILPIEIRAK